MEKVFAGRVTPPEELGRMYFDGPGDGIVYTDVSTRGVRTLHPRVGKVIGWLCALGLLGLVMK